MSVSFFSQTVQHHAELRTGNRVLSVTATLKGLLQLEWMQETHPIWTSSPCHNYISPLLTCVGTLSHCVSGFASAPWWWAWSSNPFQLSCFPEGFILWQGYLLMSAWCAIKTTAWLDCSAFPNYVVMEISVKFTLKVIFNVFNIWNWAADFSFPFQKSSAVKVPFESVCPVTSIMLCKW